MRHLQLKEYSSLVLGLLGWVIPEPYREFEVTERESSRICGDQNARENAWELGWNLHCEI